MNYEVDIKPRLDAGKTHAQIAAEVNAERRAIVTNYRAISSTQVTDWLASSGRLFRIDKALTAFSQSENAALYYDTLASAWDGLKAIRGNINSTMIVHPGSPHRELVITAISLGLMIQSDLDALDALAYHGSDVTEEQVTTAVNAYEGINGQWGRLFGLGQTYINNNPNATLQEVFDAVKGNV